MPKMKCQLTEIEQITNGNTTLNVIYQRSIQNINKLRPKRLIMGTKRRIQVLFCRLGITQKKKDQIILEKADLVAGDWVRVRAPHEIKETLDKWNRLKGCGFMEEMWPHCGKEYRVFKRIKMFLDERDHLLKKCSGIVILENVLCSGTAKYGPCDRSCFYFWRDEWLQKIKKIND